MEAVAKGGEGNAACLQVPLGAPVLGGRREGGIFPCAHVARVDEAPRTGLPGRVDGGAVKAQGLVAQLVCGDEQDLLRLAAAPGYLADNGIPTDLEDLARHEAIRYRLPDGPFLPWILKDGPRTITVGPVMRLALSGDALDTGRAYARAGIGIIGAVRTWLEDAFAAGTLVPVLPDRWSDMDGPRLCYPDRSGSAALGAFVAICRRTRGR